MSLLRDDLPMTIDEFLVFTEEQPNEGVWELIDGEPMLNPSPSYSHQKIVRNVLAALIAAEDRGASWEVLPGLGARLSEISMPVPDVLVRPRVRISGHFCDDMIVAFEVISPSSRSRDLRWKRQAYPGLPSLQHYVVLRQDSADMRAFDRASGWAERRVAGSDALLVLDAIGVALTAKAVYQDTGLV